MHIEESHFAELYLTQVFNMSFAVLKGGDSVKYNNFMTPVLYARHLPTFWSELTTSILFMGTRVRTTKRSFSIPNMEGAGSSETLENLYQIT
jgi:hypothetical protein